VIEELLKFPLVTLEHVDAQGEAEEIADLPGGHASEGDAVDFMLMFIRLELQ
jgi:hypothetical protein